MEQVEQHWIFAGFCAAVIVLIVRLIMHERITLQSSLTFLGLLAAMIALALFPDATSWAARRMGFVLPSNFLFTLGIGALALLNVATLVTLSRVELRSITLTQELGLLEERIDRLTAGAAPPRADPGATRSPGA